MLDIESALSFTAKLKGVPIIYPMLDLEEQQKISVNDVLGTDAKNLLAVSARYEVPAVMAAHLVKKADCWQSDWAFYFDNKIKQWTSGCVPLKSSITVGIKGAYDVLSNYYGLKPETPVAPAAQ
jgi:hypothetical protein